MKRIFKRILVFLIMMIFVIIPVSAATDDSVQPLWDNTTAIRATINFLGTQGTYSAIITGDTDVTDIIAFAKLYYKDNSGDWIEIPMPWGFISTTDELCIGENFSAESGVEYKVELEANVYVDYDCETIYVTTTSVCP